MKTVKMSLANLKGKMSRKEMKNIMAGSGNDSIPGVKITCGRKEGYCWALSNCGSPTMDCPCVFTGKPSNYCLKNSWW